MKMTVEKTHDCEEQVHGKGVEARPCQSSWSGHPKKKDRPSRDFSGHVWKCKSFIMQCIKIHCPWIQ